MDGHRKAYDHDMPHSWIDECLKTLRIARNVKQFICKSMKNRETELPACGESLDQFKIGRGIFQGDNLSSKVSYEVKIEREEQNASNKYMGTCTSEVWCRNNNLEQGRSEKPGQTIVKDIDIAWSILSQK